MAVANPALILWTEAMWKQWLLDYQEVINAFIYFENSIITGTPFNLTLVNMSTPIIVIWDPSYDQANMTLIAIL